MLKMTTLKIIAEASNDKLWGTGIRLRDKDALDAKTWENPGWLSDILKVYATLLN